MHGKFGHRCTMLSDDALVVDRLELEQQLARVREGRRGRCVEPVEIRRIGNAGGREIEREGREVGVKNLRRGAIEQLERVVLEP